MARDPGTSLRRVVLSAERVIIFLTLQGDGRFSVFRAVVIGCTFARYLGCSEESKSMRCSMSCGSKILPRHQHGSSYILESASVRIHQRELWHSPQPSSPQRVHRSSASPGEEYVQREESGNGFGMRGGRSSSYNPRISKSMKTTRAWSAVEKFEIPWSG